MAERAVYYTLHSQLTGLVLFKEKRRTQCRIRQKGEWDMSQKNMEVMLSMEDKADIKHEKVRKSMDTRVAVISIIVENPEAIETLNHLLHEAGQFIIGRMGIPYREKGINIISIAIDAPQDMISTLSGKIGRLSGVSTKTAYSNIITKAGE